MIFFTDLLVCFTRVLRYFLKIFQSYRDGVSRCGRDLNDFPQRVRLDISYELFPSYIVFVQTVLFRDDLNAMANLIF